jgi:hypothetical protein
MSSSGAHRTVIDRNEIQAVFHDNIKSEEEEEEEEEKSPTHSTLLYTQKAH